MSMVFISLVGNMVAVNKNGQTAEKALSEMVGSESARVIEDARLHGDVRRSIRIRTIHVELND